MTGIGNARTIDNNIDCGFTGFIKCTIITMTAARQDGGYYPDSLRCVNMNDPDAVFKKIVRHLLNSKYLLWLVLALPFFDQLNSFLAGDFLYGEALHASGTISARLMLLTLAITPMRLLFPGARWPVWFLRRRRWFGVAAFVYAGIHTAVYLHRKIGSGLVLQEAAEFSMWTGWLALAILVPLTLTSNDASVRWLEKAWKKLHRWIYPAAALTFLHWIFAAFSFVPGLIHFFILFVLEIYRIWKRRQLRLLSAASPQGH